MPVDPTLPSGHIPAHMKPRPPHPPCSRSRGLLVTLTVVLLACAGDGAAQTIGSGSGMRFGVSFGGISTVGLTAEFFDDHHAVDLTVGTWSFRDISLSVVGKQYFGGGSAHPFVGLGFWMVAAAPKDERMGFAAVLRAPVGVDWQVQGSHALGAALNVNRGLFVRRTDPEDDLPLNKRLVPLPEVYYRLTR